MGDMDVAVHLWYRDVSSSEQEIFVDFDLSKVRQCLRKENIFYKFKMG